MTSFPALIEDGFYYDLSMFVLGSTSTLGGNMKLRFEQTGNPKRGFVLEMQDVVALNDWRSDQQLRKIRVDHERTCYSLDISLQLKRPEYEFYKVLYLFDKIGPTGPVFRALAQQMEVRYF